MKVKVKFLFEETKNVKQYYIKKKEVKQNERVQPQAQ